MKTTVTRATLVGALMGVMVAGQSMAVTTVWNPAANGIVPPAVGDFGNSNNWTAGVPSASEPVKAVYNVGGAADCVVSNNAYSGFQIVQGDNGPGGTLIITNGGTITTRVEWTAVGYNNTARAVVGPGGTYNFGEHAWIGFNPGADGTVDIDGGTVNVSGMFGLGWNGGKGTVHVNSGTLNCAQWSDTGSIKGLSVLDVGAGTVLITGDHTNSVDDYIGSSKIKAYGGSGTVLYDYSTNLNVTTITGMTGAPPPIEVVWDPASNPGGNGTWGEDANWTGGQGPGNTTKVVFNIAGAIPCKVTGPSTAGRIVSGDTGPGGTLMITNGAFLSVGDSDASIIGEFNTGTLLVENGAGGATFGHDLMIGLNTGADGVFTMNDGLVTVAGMFTLGWWGGTGTAHINGGTLEVDGVWDYSTILGSSVLDIAGSGKVVIAGYAVDSVEYFVSIGQITANGGTNVFVTYNPPNDETTVAAEYIPPVQTVWNPAANPSSDGSWSDGANWSDGLPGSITKTVFNVPDATNCVVSTTNASAGRVVVGDNGPGGTLIVTNGGILTVGDQDWSALNFNYTNTPTTMVVADGGSASFGHHLWIGHQAGASGVLIMNGGTVRVDQQIGLGWSGGTGTVLVKGGTLDLNQIAYPRSISATSVLDVSGTGEVLINGNRLTEVSGFVADGRITVNGGPNVIYYYDDDANKTVITTVPVPQDITDITVAGGTVTVTYDTFAGQTYHIESTPGLTAPIVWTPVAGTTTNAAGSSVTSSFPAGANDTYYRSVSP